MPIKTYCPLVGETPGRLLAIQPESRGTSAAIAKIRAADPRAIVAIFPSDHYFSNDLHLMRHVAIAARAVAQMPSKLVLLGVSPDRLDIRLRLDRAWDRRREQSCPYNSTRRERRRVKGEPIRRLMTAILVDAVYCYPAGARRGWKDQEGSEARLWIFGELAEFPFSFGNVCAELGISQERLRERLLLDEERIPAVASHAWFGARQCLWAAATQRSCEGKHSSGQALIKPSRVAGGEKLQASLTISLRSVFP